MNDEMKEIKLFEAFAGIGAQFKALKNISKRKKWNIKSVGQIEWYLDAIIAYLAIHHNEYTNQKELLKDKIFTISRDSKNPISPLALKKLKNSREAYYLNKSQVKYGNLFDINKTKGKKIPANIDIFTYSFPCQDLSVQGKGKGMLKESNTHSSLIWKIERIFKEMKKSFTKKEMPKYLLLENVKNMISKKHKDSYELWVKKLKNLGYESKTYILNSKNFGAAQNRTRVYCLSIRKDWKEKTEFKFSDLESIEIKPSKISSILEKKEKSISRERERERVEQKFKHFHTISTTTTKSGIRRKSLLNYTTFNSENYVYHKDFIGPTLTASGANSRIKIDLNWDTKKKLKIKYMSAKEAYKYMGFTYKDYKKVEKTNLLNQNKIIFTAGNSISIQVLEELFATLVFKKVEKHE